MKNTLRQILAYAGIVLLFLAISYAYCHPLLEGKIVNQSDISGWTGMAQETIQHNKANPDDHTLWSNSMFGGMPNVTFFDQFEGDATNPLYKALLWGKRPATYLFVALLGAFLLMLSLGVDKLIAVGGALAIAFCSYNMQIIQVGHNTKMQAIAFFPWVLAGLIFTYRSALGRVNSKGDGEKAGDGSRSGAYTHAQRSEAAAAGVKSWLPQTILGSVLFAVALSFQIKANHPQITWYLAVTIFIYAIALLIGIAVRKAERSKLGRFFTASALLLAVGIVGIATNANKLLPTYNYAKYTMRGGSELTKNGDGTGSKGLDLDYATAWSYGIEETPNLLIPNYNGGASASAIGKDSESAKLLKKYGIKGRELDTWLRNMPTYWGPQPFTAGPMYMGAISIFLFILGCCVCKGREKWWMIAASIFAILLAWGNHFMWFTKLCFNTLPMYNKFRTVSMALIVLQCTLPMLGFLALDKVFKMEVPEKEMKKKLSIAALISVGLCLLLFLMQKIGGSFMSASDQKELAEALAADRASMLAKDTFRSIAFILLAFVSIYFLCGSKMQSGKLAGNKIMALVVTALVALDLVPVDLRYLNSSHFVEKKDFSKQFEQRKVDSAILADEEPDFRVLDLSVNTFNDSHTSYWHKSIGGYSPAKLQRYQDLIDRHIMPEMRSIIGVVNKAGTVAGVEENFPETPILNALNTKYVIVDANFPPVENINRFGNCWFVDDIAQAASPDAEIQLLDEVDLHHFAVVGRDMVADLSLPDTVLGRCGLDMSDIRLVSYKPNELVYSYVAETDRIAVFSEIWHPGWKATINGEPLKISRADWILRAAVIPHGEGEIVMRYEPDDYRVGRTISTASSTILLLLLLASAGGLVFIRRKF
ncbi:MAG: YfhO family protein [Bacteroidales bacterium]|nr:YfhO family protein [Bacteroidales bacterium]